MGKITLEVEAPEGAQVSGEELERITRALILAVASRHLAGKLKPSDREVEDIIEAVRKGMRR